MLFFFPIGVFPLASAPWQTVQPLLKIEAPSAELAAGPAGAGVSVFLGTSVGWVSCRGEGAAAGGGTVAVVAAVCVRAGEAEDFVSFVVDSSRAVREVATGIAGVVVEAGGAALATVDEVAVLSLVVDATLPVVALLLVVVVSLFWQAATSETANAMAIAVFADFMMFPPFERTPLSLHHSGSGRRN
jgi:hypothetical protein